MKKLFLTPMVVFLLLIAVSTNGYCYTFNDLYFENYWDPGYDYGEGAVGNLGTYLGTIATKGAMGEGDLEAFFVSGGYTVGTLTSGFHSVSTQFKTEAETEAIAGQWSVDLVPPPATQAYVAFVVVKGSTSFSVHQYDNELSGIWNVGYLADAGGSGAPADMSFVRAFTGGEIPTPEPSTMILLGLGVMGLVGVGRKSLRK